MSKLYDQTEAALMAAESGKDFDEEAEELKCERYFIIPEKQVADLLSKLSFLAANAPHSKQMIIEEIEPVLTSLQELKYGKY